MAVVPRLDSIEQSIAISGFTDAQHRDGYIDLDDKLPVGSFVMGWRGSVTTRFTGGLAGQTQLAVGMPGDELAFSRHGWIPVESGAANELADVPDPAFTADPPGVERTIRVTVRDELDFGNISGGALTVTVYYMRTVI